MTAVTTNVQNEIHIVTLDQFSPMECYGIVTRETVGKINGHWITGPPSQHRLGSPALIGHAGKWHHNASLLVIPSCRPLLQQLMQQNPF